LQLKNRGVTSLEIDLIHKFLFLRCKSEGSHPYVGMQHYVEHGLASGGDSTLTDEPSGNPLIIDFMGMLYIYNIISC